MKKYLFGLGAMLVGAGLMFIFTHTEVSAESGVDTIGADCTPIIHKTHKYKMGSYCKN